ncbi:alpha/beta hydrolase [Vibrio sonorensis]|uniref:alpha/beta hydrolase n=1 Tax=Vibrio sonorensis TaxID=1004316 RepID=UPI0008DA1026|nr:alpha/beta hydrolase [Vibrio sonorensis]
MVSLLEAGIRPLVEGFIQDGRPCPSSLPVEVRRAGYLASTDLAGKSEPVFKEWLESIEGFTFRVFRPSDEDNLPLILYFHGGCFISGSYQTHEQQLRELATQSNSVVVCLSYRLAPENVYPTAHDNVFRASQLARERAEQFGARKDRVHFVGDSAGGHLALSTALRLKQAGKWQASSLVLIYPMLDPYGLSESYRENGKDYIITANMLLSGFDMYRNGLEQAEAPELFPLQREDLAGLPRTHILTAEFDPLHDEGEALNYLLKEQGVDTHYQMYPGVIHGFYQLSGVSESARYSIKEISKFLNKSR